MNKILKSEEGFTLIEFMLAILITSIITAVIAVYLSSHFKTYETAQDINDVQYESQVVLNDLSRIAMEADGGVYAIQSSLGNDISSMTTSTEPYMIVLKDIEYDDYYIFLRDLSAGDDKIYYKKESTNFNNAMTVATGTTAIPSGFQLFATNVDEFKIDPLGETFADTDHIEFTLTIKKDGIDYTGTTQVKLRNK